MAKGRSAAAVLCATALAMVPLTAAQAGGREHPGDGRGSPHGGLVVGACRGATHATIQAAVDAATSGQTIRVCPGTYSEDVLVDKPVTLLGSGATVSPDADDSTFLTEPTGGNNGFTVVSPHVTIRGFTVSGATGDGILLLGDHGLVEDTLTEHNGINGINVDGSAWSTIRANTVRSNGGGIELANDPDAADLSLPGVTGHAEFDTIIGNRVVDNPEACAIYLVDHAGLGRDKGVHHNLIAGNTVTGNALQGYGAGVLMASPLPGGAVYDNTIRGNHIDNNGLPGVSVHSHAPDQDFTGNKVIGNDIGTNNELGAEYNDTETTGVYVGTVDPLTITIVGNRIHGDHYGIFLAGPVTVHQLQANHFHDVTDLLGTSGDYAE